MDLVKFKGVVEGSRRSIVGLRAQRLLCVIQKVLEAAEHDGDKKESLLRCLASMLQSWRKKMVFRSTDTRTARRNDNKRIEGIKPYSVESPQGTHIK